MILTFLSTQALALLHLNHHLQRPLLALSHNQRIIPKQSSQQQNISSSIQPARYRTPRRSPSPQSFSVPTACPPLYLSFRRPNNINLSTYPLPTLHSPHYPPPNLHLQRLQTHLSNIHLPLFPSGYRSLIYYPSSVLEPPQFLKRPKISPKRPKLSLKRPNINEQIQTPRLHCRSSSSTDCTVVVRVDDPSIYHRHSMGRFRSIAHPIGVRNWRNYCLPFTILNSFLPRSCR